MNRRNFSSALLKLGLVSPLLSNLSKTPFAVEPPHSARDGADLLPNPPSLENQYRGYIVDHHSPDPPAMTYSKFDPEQWVHLYQAADLDHDWVFCKGHHGEAYYPTKVGHMHPGLKIDFVKAISERLRQKGIAFHAYYCIGFDDWAVINHPDWALRDEEGKNRRVERSEGAHSWGQWHWTCVNTPYRQYVFTQLTEIVKGYNPDGIFIDILGQPLCYCKYCERLYLARFGHEIPRDGARERQWQEIDQFLYQTTQLSFMKELIGTVRGLGSKAAITVNGGHLSFRRELLELLDYTFAEPWAGNYLSAMFARGTGKLPEIGPGSVAPVYDPSPASIFEIESAMIASQNCRVFMYSETMHPDGTLDPLWFHEMGTAYKAIEKVQPYLVDRDSVPCVGIIYSEKSRFNDRVDLRPALRGAMEAGVNSQFPSDVLPDWRLDLSHLKAYQAVVLPEVTCLSEEDVQNVTQYVRDGGLLIVTGMTGTKQGDGQERSNFALAELIGCDFVRVDKSYLGNFWGSYLRRNNDPFWNHLPDTNLVVEAPFVVVKPRPGTRVLATHILPVVVWRKDTDENDEDWVNWEPPPPGKETNFPALLENNDGKGKVLYSSFNLYGMIDKGFEWPLEFNYRLLTSNLKSPPLRVELDERQSVGTTFYRKRSGRRIVIQQINRTVPLLKGAVNPVKGGKLIVNASHFRPTACRQIYPAQQQLKLQRSTGFVEIELPDVTVHSVLSLEVEIL
ncbi:MAG TPA: alpha-L-fucosidase [Terriglobia bacterium]|nr:alpha-L-fucosidase [Terriglobia bacterium]